MTAALAIIVLIVAWLLRRAGARRADEDESYGEPVFDKAALDRRLDGISLDLDQPPTDEPRPGGPR